MKNVTSFLVAMLASVFIYISVNLFNLINSAFEPAGLFMNVFQIIIIVKCIALVIFFTPAKIDLKQVAYGYLLANTFIVGYHIITYSVIAFPIYIVIFQAVQVIGYLILQGRVKVSESSKLRIPEKAKLITERI
ncbi:hypothetical protein [Mucilaginibacter aquaedulcis]|uniref:hypothetical protein n=1 Tax=Mucilaginibacter aquaedulcis TaxID=1187081 RepID=UPI0025B34C97|nr:hypothetical protein [Mucilaginibacter aquaedulcis]MDN3548617.1 hypothetical protein [Mucilaginibacter aquaedulcis]